MPRSSANLPRSAAIMLMGTALLTVAALTGCSQKEAAERVERVIINGHGFRLELAAKGPDREQGLMHRTEIPEDGGMLFVFPNSDIQQFWMADCLVDIDLIYLDGVGRVTAMHRMKALPPQREDETRADYERRVRRDGGGYTSVLPARFAIELRAGWLDRLDLHVQDRVELPVDRLKAMAD